MYVKFIEYIISNIKKKKFKIFLILFKNLFKLFFFFFFEKINKNT